MKYLLALPLFLIVVSGYAQKSSVSGQVTDDQTKESIDYASVALYKTNDSSLVTGVVTDQNGKFIIENLNKGVYFIRIQFLGYKTKQSGSFTLAAGQNYEMGAISLEPGSQLMNEVEVSGKRVNNENKLDKQTYRADQFESAKGGSAVDVLKNMPSVAVNGEGNITVRGSSGFLVMINGKPVLTDAETALNQVPANMIDNIELITSPSAKYDPDGKAGIINIITKKGATNGTGVSVNAQYGLPGTTDFNNTRNPTRYGLDALLNYKKNKWDISVGGNYTRNDLAGFREGNVYTDNVANNYVTRYPSTGERSFYRYNYAARALIRYTAGPSDVLTAGFYRGGRYQNREADLFYTNSTWTLDTNVKIGDHPYYNANNQIKQGTFTIGNFDYAHTFKDQSSIKASFLYEYDDLFGITQNRNLTEPEGAYLQYVENPYQKPIRGYRANLDHSILIGKGKLESGYLFRNDYQDGNFEYLITPAIPDQPNLDRFSGTAVSKNLIQSVYSQYSGTSEKLDYNFGLRYEYSHRTVKLSFDPETHVLNLSNLFPSANILYSVTPDFKLKAGYSRRIERSTNNQLNPIPEREHSETLEMGDPDLLPEFVGITEVGLINNFKNGGSVFVTAYFRDGKNPVQRVNSIYADTILNRVYTNVKKGYATGFETGADIPFFKWWNFYAGVNVYKQVYKGDLKILNAPAIAINNSGWVYSINANTTFNITGSLSLQANVNYLSKRVTAQGEDSRYLIPNLSLKKTFAHNRFSAAVQWQNIDLGMHQTNRQRITTSGEYFYTTTNYIYETDIIMLNLGFNINKINKNQLPSSEFGEKEF